MPLTRRIPKAAMGMVKIIREEVLRPEGLPRVGQVLSGRPRRLCFARSGENLMTSCPMGLIPGAVRLPWYQIDFPSRIRVYCDRIGIMEFGRWWDEQDDAQAATDAVWLKKRSRAAKKK